ncbi:ATP-binding protein [Streptomyces sp. NPDC059740]|uniref:ATP-binding protein n=1 Tax=Streptomyces sp. NPDC059740 TaxID=3346926 RepID=UPI003668B9CD
MAEARSEQFRQELAVQRPASGGVRRIVRAHLRLWGFERLVDDAVLCVQELLANVVRHTDSSECALTLERRPDRVRLTVSDASGELPTLREPDWGAESGRGLWLVAELADAWGAVRTAGGKDVWCELRATPPRREAV